MERKEWKGAAGATTKARVLKLVTGGVEYGDSATAAAGVCFDNPAGTPPEVWLAVADDALRPILPVALEDMTPDISIEGVSVCVRPNGYGKAAGMGDSGSQAVGYSSRPPDGIRNRSITITSNGVRMAYVRIAPHVAP